MSVITGTGLQLAAPEIKGVLLHRSFALALCQHLGLNPGYVSASDFEITAGLNEIFGVRLHVALTSEDLAAIAERMKNEL